jgi:dTDP-glucose 4,6-dehydratase
MTILEFAEAVQKVAGSNLPIRHESLPEDDPKRRRPDISKARGLLGWEPRVPLEEGLRRTWEYFRDLQSE